MLLLLKRYRLSGISYIYKRGLTSQTTNELDIINEKLARLREQIMKNSKRKKDAFPDAATSSNEQTTKLPKIQPFSIKIISTGFMNDTKSCVLMSDDHFYLINCGESISRFLNSEKIGLKRIEHLFLTRIDWSCIGGMNSLTIELGQEKKSLKIHSAFDFKNEFKKNRSIFEKDCTLSQHDYSNDFYFEDENVKVKPIHHSIAESSYLFTLKKSTPRVLKEKIEEFQLLPGPWIKDILVGKDHTTPDGRLIKASQLLDFNSAQEKHVLFFDCKNEATFEDLMKKVNDQLLNSANTFIVHLSKMSLVKSELYSSWMKSLNECIHIVLDESRPSIDIGRIYELQAQLNLVNPSLFPLLPAQKITPNVSTPNLAYVHGEFNLSVLVKPEFGLDHTKVVQIDNKKYLNNLFDYYESNLKLELEGIEPKVQEILDELKHKTETDSQIKNETSSENENFPKVVLMGTSSAQASTYRNVSGVLVQLTNQTNMLLDCGEGFKNQMARFFESDQLNKQLCKIKCIFISHNHTDHHNGLYGLVMRRFQAFNELNLTYEPLFIMFPRYLMLHLMSIERICKQGFFDLVKLVPNELFTTDFSATNYSHLKSKNNQNEKRLPINQPYLAEEFDLNVRSEITEQLKKSINLAEIKTVRVTHIPYSYALIVTTNEKKQFKFAFSGDCRPSKFFAENGKNCDLLIHECTFDDTRLDRAISEKHSTQSEASEIAQKMNAKNTILTHFSPRYGVYPFTNQVLRPGVAFGFDFMQVDTQNVNLLHDNRLNDVLKVLFHEQIEINLNRSDKKQIKLKLDKQDT